MKFSYHPRIISQLGTELITSDEVAISELIKNSFDAKANNVNVTFLSNFSELNQDNFLNQFNQNVIDKISPILSNNKILVIEDNGSGMNYETLENGFFKVGTTLKKEKKERLKEKDRPILGDKGLGRLASQRLGNILIVETTSSDSNKVCVIKVDWNELLSEDNNTNEISSDWSFSKNIESDSYTRLWFVVNDEIFDKFLNYEKQISLLDDSVNITLKEDLLSTINFLYSPFEEKIEDFEINFWFNSYKIPVDFNNEIIKIAYAKHSFTIDKDINNRLYIRYSMSISPWYLEMIHLRLIGEEYFSEYKRDHKFYTNLLEKYKEKYSRNLVKEISEDEIERILNNSSENNNLEIPISDKPIDLIKSILTIKGEIYSFKRKGNLLSLMIDSAHSNGIISKKINQDKIRPFLETYNGVKLYRDKYRIANLGNMDSDWLKFQQAKVIGQQFFRFELGNIIGYVKINDIHQKYIQEISSRQSLSQSDSTKALMDILYFIFNVKFYDLNRKAYYITKDILDNENLLKKSISESLKSNINDTEKVIGLLKNNSIKLQEEVTNIKDSIALDTKEKIDQVKSSFKKIANHISKITENIDSTVNNLDKTSNGIKVLEQEKAQIKIRLYNDYKLMANGLITEVLTHELHSLIKGNDQTTDNIGDYIKNIEDFLINLGTTDGVNIYKNNVKKLQTKIKHLYSRMSELNVFYDFLEKTFLKKGNIDDFDNENLYTFFELLEKRMSDRLNKGKIEFDYTSLNNLTLLVPKGVLIHIFYNLIDNSIYWIKERREKSKIDNTFKSNKDDFIKIEKIDSNTLHFYDSGTGVYEKMKDILFHPLESGKDNGRGMGLYIVKNLLESFDSNIYLLEEVNEYNNRYKFEIKLNYLNGR